MYVSDISFPKVRTSHWLQKALKVAAAGFLVVVYVALVGWIPGAIRAERTECETGGVMVGIDKLGNVWCSVSMKR